MSKVSLRTLISENPIFKEKQMLDYNCGPTAMTYCLSVLGLEIDQDSLCGSLLEKLKMKYLGTAPTWFALVARINEVYYEDVYSISEEGFLNKLLETLEDGTAILLVNSGHWVSIVAYCESTKKFIINDPANENVVLEKWSEKKLLEEALFSNEWMGLEGYYAFAMKN